MPERPRAAIPLLTSSLSATTAEVVNTKNGQCERARSARAHSLGRSHDSGECTNLRGVLDGDLEVADSAGLCAPCPKYRLAFEQGSLAT